MRQRGIDFFSIRPGFNRFDAVDCGFHGKLRDNRWTSKWSFASRRLVKVGIKTRIVYKSSISSIVGIRMISFFFFFTDFEISSLKIDKIDDNWIIRFDWFFFRFYEQIEKVVVEERNFQFNKIKIELNFLWCDTSAI